MKIKNSILMASLFAVTTSSFVYAKDDTDIYFPEESASTSQNVLFVMDVSGSMRREIGNTGVNRFEAMKSAFNEILNTVPPSINVGLMNFGSIGSDRNNYAQGVKFPVSPLTANARDIVEQGLPLNNGGNPNWAANNIPEPASGMTVFDFLPEVANSWDPNGWTPLVDSLYEAALYYRGEQVYWGLGPLEENGNEWVAHPSTYTGQPGAWDAANCSTTFQERLIDGIFNTGNAPGYVCPHPTDPSAAGHASYCEQVKTDCIAAPGGGGGDDNSCDSTPVSGDAENSTYSDVTIEYEISGSWSNSSGRKWSSQPGNNPVYNFTVTQTDTIKIILDGHNDDAYLWLVYPNGTTTAYDDDSAGNYDSKIERSLAPGDYKIYAATYSSGENGSFTLTVEGAVTGLAGDGSYQLEGEWTSSGGFDESDPDNPHYYFTVTQAGTVTIDLDEGERDVDPYLYLLDESGAVLEEDDNSGGGDDARISRNLDPGIYKIVAAKTEDTASGDGDFTIELDGNIGEFPYTGQVTTIPACSSSSTDFQVGNTATTGGSNDTQTVSHTLEAGSDRIVVAGVAIERGSNNVGSVTSITYGGVSMDSIGSSEVYTGSSTKITTELFYLLDAALPNDGSNTLSVSINGGEMSVGVVTLHGLKQQAAEVVATNSGTSNTSSGSTSLTPLSDNAVIVDIIGGGHGTSSGSFDVDSDQTEVWSENAGSSQGTFSVKAVSSAGTHSMAWSWNNSGSSLNRYAHSVAAFALAEVSSSSQQPSGNQARYVKLIAKSEQNGNPWTSIAEIELVDADGNEISQSGWSATVDSFEPTGEGSKGGHASHAIDGDVATHWHTEWQATDPDPGHDHQIIIDMGATHDLSELHLLPRQDGGANGRIDAYEIYLSTDGSNWGSAIATGNFDDNASEQVVDFPDNSGSGSGSGSGTGSGTGTKVAVCHIPPGNPDNAHTIVVGEPALSAHLAHGDLEGACGSGISSENEAEGTCLYTMCSGAAVPEPTYVTPVKSACQSNAIILLSDGHPEAGGAISVNATYDKIVTANEGSGGLIDVFRNLNCESSPEGLPRGTCGPELTAYLATNDNLDSFEGDQTIQTYTVGLGLGQGSAAEDYLKSLSTVDDPDTAGVEGYFSATDEATLVTAFSEILSELELNTTTTAFSNPGYSIVAKTGLNHENSVFIPTFEVGNNALWKGNLKKFQIFNVNGNRQIRGKNDQNAVTELGAFSVGALDMWSTSNTADGTDVTKGGAASLLVPADRHLYTDLTCSNAAVCDLTDNGNSISIDNVSSSDGLGNGNASENATANSNADSANNTASGITNAHLGLTSGDTNERKKYICFIRGYQDYDSNAGECTGTARKHMGDMLHFEPIVVTYDTAHDDKNDATHKQVIFAGTNEGYLHAFDTHTGEEIFGFMPKELLQNIKPQFYDSEYRGHRYGIDGYASTWVNDIDQDGVVEPDNGEFVYLYFGLRRGGNTFYAMDVTNPSSPKLRWKIEGGQGNFEYMGESWSRPYLGKIQSGNRDATLKEVLVFAGGYDSENQDKDLADRAAADSVGKDVFIVDAKTGAFIWSAKQGTTGSSPISGSNGLTHSVPGGVRILDMNKDGAIDRMYFADVAGNVWRLELDTDLFDDDDDSFNLNDAKLIKLASLGGAQTGEEPRKFFHEPDVSLSRKDGRASLLVSIGSGDRTTPLGTDTADRFYVLVDRKVVHPLPDDFMTIDNDDLAAVEMGLDSEGDITLSNELSNQSVLATTEKGWYFQFQSNGEKVLAPSITNHGKVIFTTLVPDVYANVTSSISACNVPATQGRVYVLDVLYGTPAIDLNGTGGNPDNDDLYTIVSANEIPGTVQLVFNAPTASDGTACSEGNCVQHVDLRAGKKLSQVMSYNSGVLESVFWSKPQEK